MTVDIEKLEALAKACPKTDHLRLVEYHGAWRLRNTAGTVLAVHRDRSFPDFMAQNEAYARLVEAANPAAVLELIADHKRLTSENASLRGSQKALGKDLTQAVRAANKVTRERDRLKSENAGLKTGYEAYERVNAELRAECEKLRKDAQRYRWIENPFAGLFGVESLDKYIDAAMSKEQGHD